MSKNSARAGSVTVTFLCCMLGVVTATELLPGISATDVSQALLVGVVLGVAYLVVRPVLKLIALPLGCLTFGLIYWVLDVALLYLSANIIGGFTITSVMSAVLTSLLINAVCGIAGGFK